MSPLDVCLNDLLVLVTLPITLVIRLIKYVIKGKNPVQLPSV